MRDIVTKIVILSFLVCVVETGFDIGSTATVGSMETGAHEIHHPIDSNNVPSDSDEVEAEHFCHCVTHGAALPVMAIQTNVTLGESTVNFNSVIYNSLSIPPPVPPPNA